MKLNINNRAIVAYTNTLEKMHRSALPNTIRNTLNNAIYDVKTNTMPKEAAKDFKKRSPNFFKSQSRFENAKGFNVSLMKGVVGFVSKGLKGSDNYAVKDLEQQEEGGKIGGKSFIPLNQSRVGNSFNKNVRKEFRLTNITKIVNARNQKGISKKQQFVRAIVKAGVGGYVMGSTNKGDNFVWKVTSIGEHTYNYKTTHFGLQRLYDFQKGRKVV